MTYLLKDNLAMLRNIRGYSQEQIAEKIGISRQAYAKWETGKTVPDIEKCGLLAEIYGVTVDALIKTESSDETKQIPPPPKGKNIWGMVTVGERGQIIIPKGAREKFGIVGGERLVVLGDEQGIALIPSEVFEKNLKTVMDLAHKTADEN